MTIITRLCLALPRARHASLLGLLLCTVGALLPGCRRQAPLKPYVAYVVNHQSATLAAVNLADFRVTAALPVAPQPDRVLLRPRTRQLYVVSGPGKITVAAFPHLHLVSTLDVGKSGRDLQFSPDGRAAYLLNPADHELIFLDCSGATGNPQEEAVPKVAYRIRLAGSLRDLALSPDGETLVADSENPNQITFISTETRAAIGTVEVGKAPGPLAILPDNSKVFVADTGEEKISVAALASRKLFSHIEIGTDPTALLLKPDGGEIFVLAAKSSTLVILDAFHDNVERTFPLGADPVAGAGELDLPGRRGSQGHLQQRVLR